MIGIRIGIARKTQPRVFFRHTLDDDLFANHKSKFGPRAQRNTDLAIELGRHDYVIYKITYLFFLY